MNSDKIKDILLEIHRKKYVLFIGLFLLCFGLGATYQASEDVKVLNESLYNIATTNGILTDGSTYYYIGLYKNRFNFSSYELINRTQCQELYGVTYENK